MDVVLHWIILLAAIAGWAAIAYPVLRYMVHLSEGSFRWPLIPWLVGLVAVLFVLRVACWHSLGWPAPGSWGGRLFIVFTLLATYLWPFVIDRIAHWWRRPRN